MANPRLVVCALALAWPMLPSVVLLRPTPVVAAQPAYQVGTKLKAKQDCTIKGYAIKRGVVLTVTGVTKNPKGDVVTVDLSFSGMSIDAVDVETVNGNFVRA
jgi:hypothetical protein